MKQKNSASQKIIVLFFTGLPGLFVSQSLAQQNIEPSPSAKFMSQDGKQQSVQSLKGTSTSLSAGNGLCFTPNKGQIVDMVGNLCPDLLYKGDGGGADIYLRKTGISYVYNNMGTVQHKVNEQVEELIQAGTITEADEHKRKVELLQRESIKIHRVDMDFANCNENIKRLNEDEVGGYNNYYYAHCPQGVTNVKQYNKVTYKNIYNGIDVKYYGGKEQGIKYDIIVQPHADPNQIKLIWKGAESIHLKREGSLEIKTSVNEFTESIPKVYQNINGKVIYIKAKYILSLPPSGGEGGGLVVSFELGSWNTEHTLVIDPWVTYYGGSQFEYSTGIATDPIGNVVIVGITGSINFPTGASALNVVQQGANGGGIGNKMDAFVVKFDPSGARLWATYYGGSKEDQGNDIAIDLGGNVVITGYTYGSFPIGVSPPNVIHQAAFGGGAMFDADVFIVKFNPIGARVWATYYGGNRDDVGLGITTDPVGNVIITGRTAGSFPIGSSPPNVIQQAAFGGGAYDAFVVKFNPMGGMIWATYYGGNGDENFLNYSSMGGVTSDLSGNVVICGYTTGGGFPTGANPPNVVQQNVYGGGFTDAFVVKFDPTGNRLWATYCGGSGMELGVSIAPDPSGNVVIVGSTSSINFPTGASPPNVVQQAVYGGVSDAFVVKFDPTGALQWATYLGGTSSDYCNSVAVDMSTSDVYVSGDTYSLNFPVSLCAWQQNLAGGISEDAFVTHFKPDGNLICSSYVGGPGTANDENSTIALYGCYVYMTGFTGGLYPVTTGAWQTTYGGGYDAFVAQLYKNSCGFNKIATLTATASANTVCNNTPINFASNFSVSCDSNTVSYTWSFPGGTPATSNNQNPTGIMYATAGNYTVQLKAKTTCDSSIKDVNLTINQCTVCNLLGQFTKGTANCPSCGCKEWIIVNATGGTSPYSYSWPDGYDKRYKNHLCPGDYTINIKDKNGCSVNVNLTAP